MSAFRKPLRVAQLSFWFIHAEQFCLAAREHPEVELVAVWDNETERGRAAAERHGVPFVGDLDRLLADHDLDAVSLCAEPFRHPDLVEAAAGAGCHLLIEKPMAADLAGAKRVVEAVRDAGVQAMPAYNLRFNPVSRALAEILASGQLGRLARVRRWHGHSVAYEAGGFHGRTIAEQRGWGDPVAEKRDSLWFAGAHSALWMVWLLGLPEAAQCMTGTVTEDLPVEDNAVATLRYPGGLVATMESSETLLAQQTVAELYGTEGVLVQTAGNLPSTRVWAQSRAPLWLFRRDVQAWEAPELPPQFLRHEEPHSPPGRFFRALLDGRAVPTDAVDGYHSIAVLAAADQAARERREVPVAPPIEARAGVGANR